MEENQFSPSEEELLRQEFEQKCELKRQWLENEMAMSGKYLDVSAKKLDDLDALTIAFFLHDCKTELKLFHIGANHFTDRGLIDILTGLQWQSKLQEIYIGNNNFTEIGIEAFVETMDMFTELRILSMGNCNMTDDNFIKMCYQLGELKKLQQLLVPSNKIGDFGVICLSSLITTQSLPSLRVLHLGDNPITAYALNSFFLALQKNQTIKTIYLNDIGLEIQTIRHIADCLRKNKTIEELNLGNTGFSDQAAEIMWEVLPSSTLKSLQLWNNHITDQAIIKFIDVLEDNILDLQYIGLADNPIEDESLVKDINDILKQNQMIEAMAEKYIKSENESNVKPKVDNKNKEETKQQQEEDKTMNDKVDDKQEEDNEEEDEKWLQELDRNLKETNELEKSLVKKEKQMEHSQVNQEPEQNNPLQGQLKTYKWTGEEKDQNDKNFLHSKLQAV